MSATLPNCVGSKTSLGVCNKCRKTAPATYENRDERIYLVKHCEVCGDTEALVSSSAKRWQEKRDLCGYAEESARNCSLNCTSCNHGKPPSLVFLDVTNRCNMNCPICLANITAMGFQFDPPMSYFEKVFKAVAAIQPRPKIQLFGGEPTVRRDLVDIIRLAKSYGLSARVVTNGLKMADEEYCKNLLATGTQLMFAFDGRHPDIYSKIRKNPKTLEQKIAGLDNVRKYRKSKVTIMCCVGLGVNDEYMADTIEFLHDRRDYIAALDLIPLVETWGPEQVEAGNTTIDDVENIMANAIPGTEFIPAGMLYHIRTLKENFDLGRLTFGGAHPNCESVTALVSDGERYRPLSNYLRCSFSSLAKQIIDIDQEMGRKLPASLWSKLFGKKGRQFVLASKLFFLLRRSINFKEVFGGNATARTIKILFGLLRGKKMKNLLRRHTKCQSLLRIIVLPFEEPDNVESERLVECPAAFAYEHPMTRDIQFMPVCSWCIYKDSILRLTSERYGVAS